jgi:RimJ/RimL family protein N-acetyltransferase
VGFGGLSYKIYGDLERLNLGFRLAPTVWGNGLATELTQMALAIAFEKINAAEVYGLTRPQNIPSSMSWRNAE